MRLSNLLLIVSSVLLLSVCLFAVRTAEAASFPPTIGERSVQSSDTSATISVTINPRSEQTSYYVEYGPTSGYGQSTSPVQMPEIDSVDHPVTITLSGLTPDSDVNWRLVASNGTGTSVSANHSFRTWKTDAITPLPTDAPVVVTDVTMLVSPTGGFVTPMNKSQQGGWGTYIPNPGTLTITALGTNRTVFTKPLSWSCPSTVLPDGTWGCNQRINDDWLYDLRAAQPGVYRYCVSIAAGYGYAGSVTCENYATQLNRLFSLKRSHNTSRRLATPLQVESSLVGQRAIVTTTSYRAVVSPRCKQSKVGKWCGASKLWKKTGSSTKALTLSAHQSLLSNTRLRKNRQVVVSLAFPNLPETTFNGDDNSWQIVTGCPLTLHGPVASRLIPLWMAKKPLRRFDWQGRRGPCKGSHYLDD
jgi:hypothetical protein